jgi:hypothetical protein
MNDIFLFGSRLIIDISISTKDNITRELRQKKRLQLGKYKDPHDVVDNIPTAVYADHNFNLWALSLQRLRSFLAVN